MHIVPDTHSPANPGTGGQAAVDPAPARTTRQPHRENGKFVAFVRRAIRAFARRVGDGDIEALADLVNLRADVDAAIDAALIGLRQFGYSHAEIGARIGISKQAVQQRERRIAAAETRAAA